MELIGQIIDGDVIKIWSNLDYDFNDAYLNQLDRFLNCVQEGRLKHQHDAISAIESIKVVEALYKSNSKGKKIMMDRKERFSF
jgi:predicted dehydrogenase